MTSLVLGVGAVMGKGELGGSHSTVYSGASEGAEIKDGGQLLKVSWNYRK